MKSVYGLIVATSVLLCSCAAILGGALPPVVHTTVEACAKLMNEKGRPDLAQLCMAEEGNIDALLVKLLQELEESKKTKTCK